MVFDLVTVFSKKVRFNKILSFLLGKTFCSAFRKSLVMIEPH